MFWADQIAEDFKNHKGGLLVDDMATPSGTPHVGTLRGAIIHDVAARALRTSGKEAKYTFVCNDMDPFDKIPSYLKPEDYKQFMGMPMFNVPAPEGKDNYASFYISHTYRIMEGVGCKFEKVYDSVEYKKSTFDKAIRLALDKAEDIRRIYKEVSGSERPSDWYPFQPICEKCGKIATTRVNDWDGEMVSYVCDPKLVDWAEGCGYEGKITPFGGTGKLLWKIHWPAAWFSFGVNVEGEGKDHSSAGGSRDLGNNVSKQVFGYEPPYDIPYEHLIFGGKKMSKSKGIGISAQEIYDSVAPEIIRFMMIRHPERTIDLDLKDMVIPALFDEYDKAKEAYNKVVDFPDLGRAFLYSQVSDNFNSGYSMKFSKVAHTILLPNNNILEVAKEEKGAELTEVEKTELKEREKFAAIWLKKFAPDNFKFEIQEKPPKVELTENQKKVITALAEIFEAKKSWTGEELQQEIFGLKDKLGVQPKEIFSAIYTIFLNRDSGPQAGFLLAALDHEFVAKRLKEI
jgi:lysyl-tRNA synthetase, class I